MKKICSLIGLATFAIGSIAMAQDVPTPILAVSAYDQETGQVTLKVDIDLGAWQLTDLDVRYEINGDVIADWDNAPRLPGPPDPGKVDPDIGTAGSYSTEWTTAIPGHPVPPGPGDDGWYCSIAVSGLVSITDIASTRTEVMPLSLPQVVMIHVDPPPPPPPPPAASIQGNGGGHSGCGGSSGAAIPGVLLILVGATFSEFAKHPLAKRE